MINKRDKTHKGHTLIELIVVITTMGLITLGMGGFIIQLVDTLEFVDFRSYVAQEGEKALYWIVRDIREVKDKNSILVADTTHIQFTNSDDEIIDYNFTGNSIQRNNYALCDYVESFAITYFDKNGNTLSPLPLSAGKRKQIKSLRVTMKLKRGKEELDLFSTVFPRNFYIY